MKTFCKVIIIYDSYVIHFYAMTVDAILIRLAGHVNALVTTTSVTHVDTTAAHVRVLTLGSRRVSGADSCGGDSKSIGNNHVGIARIRENERGIGKDGGFVHDNGHFEMRSNF